MSTHDQLTSAREIDVLYRESDKLYYELARDCGLSETAYWIMYALEVSGGSVTQRQIASDFSYSKQTVNSALKTLEARGLVELAPDEGDRRAKLVSLTPVTMPSLAAQRTASVYQLSAGTSVKGMR